MKWYYEIALAVLLFVGVYIWRSQSGAQGVPGVDLDPVSTVYWRGDTLVVETDPADPIQSLEVWRTDPGEVELLPCEGELLREHRTLLFFRRIPGAAYRTVIRSKLRTQVLETKADAQDWLENPGRA